MDGGGVRINSAPPHIKAHTTGRWAELSSGILVLRIGENSEELTAVDRHDSRVRNPTLRTQPSVDSKITATSVASDISISQDHEQLAADSPDRTAV
jgi:hypothetical protein